MLQMQMCSGASKVDGFRRDSLSVDSTKSRRSVRVVVIVGLAMVLALVFTGFVVYLTNTFNDTLTMVNATGNDLREVTVTVGDHSPMTLTEFKAGARQDWYQSQERETITPAGELTIVAKQSDGIPWQCHAKYSVPSSLFGRHLLVTLTPDQRLICELD